MRGSTKDSESSSSSSDDDEVAPPTNGQKKPLTEADEMFGSDSSDDDDENDGDENAAKKGGKVNTEVGDDLFGSDSSDDDDDDIRLGGKSAPKAKANAESKAAGGGSDSSDDDGDAGARAQFVPKVRGQTRESAGARDSDDGEATQGRSSAQSQLLIEAPVETFTPASQLHLLKLPKMMRVAPKAYDSEAYKDDIMDEDLEADDPDVDEGPRKRAAAQAHRVRMRVYNTIRWRQFKDSDGDQVRESNARFVKWSDGTMSLVIGDQVQDVATSNIKNENHYMFCYSAAQNNQSTKPAFFQGQTQFESRMMLRPVKKAQDSAKKHAKTKDRTGTLRTGKTLKMVHNALPPEEERKLIIKREEEKLRARMRNENKKRRHTETRQRGYLDVDMLEGDDYYEDEHGMGSEEEREDAERNVKRLRASKGAVVTATTRRSITRDHVQARPSTASSSRAAAADSSSDDDNAPQVDQDLMGGDQPGASSDSE